MNKEYIISLATLPERKQAPTMVKLFSWGLNNTTKGEFVLTKESADQIIAAWKDYGNKLNVDYNHAQLFSVNPDESISAGSFDLELRETGLFAVNIEWTDKAKKLIESREYLYISPAFLTNEDNEVVELINFALTNIPATKGMDQLLAAFRLLNKDTMTETEALEAQIETQDTLPPPKEETQETETVVLSDAQEHEVLAEPMPEDVPEEVFDYKMAYEELKAEVSLIKEKLNELISSEMEDMPTEDMPEDMPADQEEMSIEDCGCGTKKKKIKKLSQAQDQDELESQLQDLKKENMIILAISEGKVLPAEKDSLKKLSLTDLENQLKDKKVINLSHSKQIIGTVESNPELEDFRNKIRSQLFRK